MDLDLDFLLTDLEGEFFFDHVFSLRFVVNYLLRYLVLDFESIEKKKNNIPKLSFMFSAENL